MTFCLIVILDKFHRDIISLFLSHFSAPTTGGLGSKTPSQMKSYLTHRPPICVLFLHPAELMVKVLVSWLGFDSYPP